jgi:hypothetical protein
MTDLNNSSIVEKRTRFFDGIALNSQDLTTEQEYHIDRHRTHNRLLRTSGILEGLEVMLSADSKTVEVTRGTAIDSLGRLIILGDTARYNERDLAITNDNKYRLAVEGYEGAVTPVTLIIKYFEEATDPAIRGRGSEGFARWHEKPILQFIKAGENDGQDSAVALAKLEISGNGQITSINSDPEDSPAYAGLKLGNNDSETILSPKPGQRLALRGSLSISETLTVSKNLQVDQDLTVGGALNFHESNRQAISFSSNDSFGIGTQEGTHYFRTSKNFAWYQSGSHATEALSPGDGGKLQMVLNAEGQLGIGTEEPKHTLDVRGGICSPSINSILALPKEGRERWKHHAVGPSWVTMIEHEIELRSRCNVAIIANGHGRTPSEKGPAVAGEIACAIFIEEEFQNQFLNGSYGFGMGFAVTDNLINKPGSVLQIPIQATACKVLEAGKHKISFRLRSDRSGTTNRSAQINGPSMLILLMGGR